MKKELKRLQIDVLDGGNQNWLVDPWMKLGGCGAVTACDCCIHLARDWGHKNLYPFPNLYQINKKEYIRFTNIMKPYLRPRMNGIDTLELFMDGFSEYLKDYKETGIVMKGLYADKPYAEFEAAIKDRIDKGMPVPCLILKHKSYNLRDYVWHWFWLSGYECFDNVCMVQAVSYGVGRWFSLEEIYNSGYTKKGGVVLLYRKDEGE